MIYSRSLPFADGKYVGGKQFTSVNFHWWNIASSKQSAIQWILQNGRKTIENLQELNPGDIQYTMYIKKMNAFESVSSLTEDFDEDAYNENILYNRDVCNEPYTSFAFTKETYNMLLEEHYQLCKNDWAEWNASSIVYVDSTNNIHYGGHDISHFVRCNALYSCPNMQKENEADFDKYITQPINMLT